MPRDGMKLKRPNIGVNELNKISFFDPRCEGSLGYVMADFIISMDETHVCVLDREGVVIHESKTASTAEAIAGELAKAPGCRRIVFETGRMTKTR
jgi:hypothetical protein